jgi:hypothetical protein
MAVAESIGADNYGRLASYRQACERLPANARAPDV